MVSPFESVVVIHLVESLLAASDVCREERKVVRTSNATWIDRGTMMSILYLDRKTKGCCDYDVLSLPLLPRRLVSNPRSAITAQMVGKPTSVELG